MIIGEKTDFAVEYDFAKDYPKNMGYGKIWIKGKFIGTNKDLIYLNSYLTGVLQDLRNKPELTDDLKRLSVKELYHRLVKDESWKYRVGSTTFIDDFIIFCFISDDKTFVIWKLIGDGTFEDLQAYSRKIHVENVLTKTLEEVIDKVEMNIKEIEI